MEVYRVGRGSTLHQGGAQNREKHGQVTKTITRQLVVAGCKIKHGIGLGFVWICYEGS